MEYDQKQFTQDGLNMFTNALSNKTNITVDKVIADDLPTNNLSNLALLSLNNFADALSFTANYTKVDNNVLTVDAIMSNEGFSNSYTVNEVGLVGHVGNDSNNQSLIAVLVASDPFTIPAQQNDETPLHLIPNITIQLSNNDMGQVPVDTSQDAYIAHKDLDKLVAQDGYIKLTDADNRYVKQSDFNNEVNQSVNEKADKSYVDQSFNQTNNEVDKKADKTDLNSLQNNINSDVQPQLNQKANQSDLSDTNNNVNSKANQSDLNNTNDVLSDVRNNRLPQTLNQATTHSDQNYSDLSDKNNILSSKVEDYQKPNIAPVTEVDNWNGTGWTYPYKFHAEQGKTYCLSAYFNNVSIFNGFIYSVEANGGEYNAANWNGGQSNPIPNGQSGLYKAKWIASQTGDISFGFGYNHTDKVSNICITQSDNYVPFEIAEQNKASIESASQTDLDNAKSYLQNKTNDLSGRIDDIDNHNFAEINPCDLNNMLTSGFYTSTSYLSQYQNIPTGIFAIVGFSIIVITSGSDVTQEIQASGMNPMFRKKQWGDWTDWHQVTTNDDLTNKTDNLSNTMNQQFDQANAHTDQVANQLNALDITNQDGKLMHAGKPLLTANAPNAPKLSLSVDKNTNNIQYQIHPSEISGGAEITGYMLYYKKDSDSSWQSKQLDTNDLVGEFNGERSADYNVQVQSKNYAGDSAKSDIYNILSADVPNIQNVQLNYIDDNNASYKINVNDNGANINLFKIYYKKQSDSNWNNFFNETNTGNIGLSREEYYDFKITAQNAVGSSNEYTFSYKYIDNHIYSVIYNSDYNNPQRALDSINVQNFSDVAPWKNVKQQNSSLQIPKFYINKYRDDRNQIHWEIANDKINDNFRLPSCFYDVENNHIYDYINISYGVDTELYYYSSASQPSHQGYFDIHALECLLTMYNIQNCNNASLLNSNTFNNYLDINLTSANCEEEMNEGEETEGISPTNFPTSIEGANLDSTNGQSTLYISDDYRRYWYQTFNTNSYYALSNEEIYLRYNIANANFIGATEGFLSYNSNGSNNLQAFGNGAYEYTRNMSRGNY